MASKTRSKRLPEGEAIAAPPAATTRHSLYDLDDVRAALGSAPMLGSWFDGDSEVEEFGVRNAALRAMLDAGEEGRWRTLAHGTPGSVDAVRGLALRAPHLRPVIEVVARRLLAAQVMGVPMSLPPLLLVGPPGIGKTWLMTRLAEAVGVPFRTFGMNLASVGDTLAGSHPIWRASAPGIVAKALLRETIANPMILVDELDKPPPPHRFGGDLYRPFHSLLEGENARGFVDEHLGIPMDASRVMWVAAANRIDEIPAPILDRLTIVEVGPMGPDERAAVLGSVYDDLRQHYRDFFDAAPAPDLVHRLSTMPPRRAKLAMDEAMTRAAAEGRRTVRASDVPGAVPAATAASTTRCVH